MPIRFVLDEHLRRGLWKAVGHHNRKSLHVLDVIRVGDPPDLPLGSKDPDILIWAEREGRILVSRDKKTMPVHFRQHVNQGRHSPGVLVIRKHSTIPQVVYFLTLVAYATDAADWQDRIEYIP